MMHNLIDRKDGKRRIYGKPLLLSIGSSLTIIPAITFFNQEYPNWWTPNKVATAAGIDKTMSLGIIGYRYFDWRSAKLLLRWFGPAIHLGDRLKGWIKKQII